MKKILGILVAVAMSTMAFAQTVGARGGVAINNPILDGGEMESFKDYLKTTNTFTAAVYADFDIPAVDGLFIQPEIGFTNHVVKLSAMGNSMTVSGNTIDLPVLVGYKYDITDSLFVKGLLGPRVSFNIGKMKFVDSGYEEELEYDNLFNFGIAAGMELGYKVGPGAAIIDARYNRDFTMITQKVNSGTTAKLGTYQSFDISIGYQMAF